MVIDLSINRADDSASHSVPVDSPLLSSSSSPTSSKSSALTPYLEFYLLAFLLDFINFICFPFYLDTEANSVFPVGGNLVYMTLWHGILQTLYLSLCLLDGLYADTIPWVRHYVSPWRHWMFSSVAFPLATFVGVMFVTLIRDFGTTTEKIIRRTYSHGGILVIIYVDLYLSKHKYADHGELSRDVGMKKVLRQSFAPIALAGIYLVWNTVANVFNHKHPYAFQDSLSMTVLLPIYLVAALLLWGSFWFGRYLNIRIHSPNLATQVPTETFG